MIKDCQFIFPTPIGLIQLLTKSECEKYNEIILNTIKQPLKKYECYCTDDNLHTLSEFNCLVKKINDEVKKFSKEILSLKENSLRLTGMWSNIRKPGSQHMVHNHPNSFLSGVLYLNVSENTNDGGHLFFHDPRIKNTTLYGDYECQSILSDRTWQYETKNGVLILFPSWLDHGTTNFVSLNDNDLRVSLSFNYMITQCSTITMKL